MTLVSMMQERDFSRKDEILLMDFSLTGIGLKVSLVIEQLFYFEKENVYMAISNVKGSLTASLKVRESRAWRTTLLDMERPAKWESSLGMPDMILP